jgi:hypothetical protein
MKVYKLFNTENGKETSKERLDIYYYRNRKNSTLYYLYIRYETVILTTKPFKDYKSFRTNPNLYGKNIIRDITEAEFNRANENCMQIEYEYTIDYQFLNVKIKEDGKKYINLFDYKKAISKLYDSEKY